MEENKPTAPMIYKKMADIMGDIGAILKNRDNTQQHYKFRGIDDVYNAVNPLLKTHRVFMTSEVLDSKREIKETTKPDGKVSTLYYSILTIKTTFYAEDGSSVYCTMQGEGMDSGDKASNKAMSVAQKYAIIQAFAIPTQEAMTDPENASPGVSEKALDDLLIEVARHTESKRLIDWANEQGDYRFNPKFQKEVKKKIKELQNMGQ